MDFTIIVFMCFLLTLLCFASFLREMLISVALGQVLSLLVCGIGLTSKYLAEDFHANTPVFQSFLNYILLFLVYTTTLAVRQGKLPLIPGI
jgi:solute carrier family 35 protein F1/2